MGKMAEVYLDVVDMLQKGDRPKKIAILLDIPESMVYDVLEKVEQEEIYSPHDTVNS